MQECASLYRSYKQGILPCGSSLNDQTALYVEVMQLLSALQTEAQVWESERTQKGKK